MIASLSSLDCPVWRMIDPARQREPFSGEGARLWGGRWNLKGWPAIYLSTDHATAIAEYYRDYPRSGTLVPYHVTTGQIAILDAGDKRVKEAIASPWRQIARRDGEVPPSWAIAQELIAAGAEGALVPSVQNTGGANLVLWRWHDAAHGGEGAALALLDPDRALAGG